MAELTDSELRAAALDAAVRFGAFRAAHGMVVPGTSQVIGAAETFYAFLQGSAASGSDADGGDAKGR